MKANDIKMFTDDILKENSQSLRKFLFMVAVDNPKLTYHNTGL